MNQNLKKIKYLKNLALQPEGQDPKFDKECRKSFYNFLEYLNKLFMIFYFCVGVTSIYFLFAYGLL